MELYGLDAHHSIFTCWPYSNPANDDSIAIIILSNIKMVKTLKQNNEEPHRCEECGFHSVFSFARIFDKVGSSVII